MSRADAHARAAAANNVSARALGKRALGLFLRANPACPQIPPASVASPSLVHPPFSPSPAPSPTTSSIFLPSDSPALSRFVAISDTASLSKAVPFGFIQGRTSVKHLPAFSLVPCSILAAHTAADHLGACPCAVREGDPIGWCTALGWSLLARRDGVLAGVPGKQLREGVRGRRGRRHGWRAGGAPPRHSPHPPAAAAAAAAARQPRDRRRAPRALRCPAATRHPPHRGHLRALPRHGRAPRLRRVPECDGLPSLRDPIAVARSRELHLRASLLHERGLRRRWHRSTANARPIPRRARQDQAAAGSGGAQAPPPGRPPRPGRHGSGHPQEGRPPRHLPRAHGDRAPRRAGARRVLLDVRVRPGAAAPGVPARWRREPRHDARFWRPRRRRQLGLLLPAGRGEVPAAGADVPAEVPRRRGLLPEEHPGGGAPRAVARPGHGRRASLRRQRRHLLGVRAGSAVLGQRQRPEAGHGGELK